MFKMIFAYIHITTMISVTVFKCYLGSVFFDSADRFKHLQYRSYRV